MAFTVVYDESCALCERCAHWLAWQPRYVEVAFLAAGSPAARERFGGLPWLGSDLVVVADDGRTWIGPAAFLVCLWTTRRWRSWSFILSGPAFAPLAERFFHMVSARRGRLSFLVGPPKCDDGRCRHREVTERRV